MDSQHEGLPADQIAGTQRAFSHYFELNNFFRSNNPTITGDTLRNSALYMEVEQRLIDNPSIVSTGNLERSNPPSNPADPPIYTYERFSGDHSVAQKLADLGTKTLNFDEAGGLPATILSFNGYTSELLGYFTTLTTSAQSAVRDEQILLDGYVSRSDAISGVNLDEELANTIIYQNAYAASAKVISVTDELFDTLLNI
jgi:flagellar hook-associated protein 1